MTFRIGPILPMQKLTDFIYFSFISLILLHFSQFNVKKYIRVYFFLHFEISSTFFFLTYLEIVIKFCLDTHLFTGAVNVIRISQLSGHIVYSNDQTKKRNVKITEYKVWIN